MGRAMNSKEKQRWKKAGLVYFTLVFLLVPTLAFAYIDPSVTTYAIQALAGVAVAAGAFFATYGRRIRKKWRQGIGVEAEGRKNREPELEVTDEKLQKELQERRNAAKTAAGNGNAEAKKKDRGRILTSLLCGLGVAVTLVLRPILSFYLANEGEFWFRLGDVIGAILLIFGGAALITFLVHFLLPGKSRKSLRLLFAVLMCAGAICVYIQNHFMSSYLPLLTGDVIDWSLYSGWNIGSIALWIGLFGIFLAGYAVRPQLTKSITYALFALLLVVESVTCGVELLTAKHENVKEKEVYFSSEGLYETSDAGNVVVLISDTFEGTYMNEILERYPEYRELLSDCTYYDNVTGVSVFTHYSYAKLMTGQDYPMGDTIQPSIRKCFDNQTLIDKVRKNGTDIAYYIDFPPTMSVTDKIMNCTTGEIKPDAGSQWEIAKALWNSTLFQSVVQPLKPLFMVYTSDYNKIREDNATGKEAPVPYVENDPKFYRTLREEGLEKVAGKPRRYTFIMLTGVHHPVEIDPEFNDASYGEETSIHDQKLIAGMASLNLMRAYLDSLKAAGTYDKTTVIMTADHGFNMRFYPMLLVKDAGPGQDQLKIDSTPISYQSDFEQIVTELTAGKSFADTIASMNLKEDRVRTAVDYCTEDAGYSSRTTIKAIINIRGRASEESSYSAERDEYELKSEVSGHYQPGENLIADSTVVNDSVTTYGIYGKGRVDRHSAVLDVAFDSVEKRALNLRISLLNRVDTDQRVVFRLGDQVVDTVTMPAGAEEEYVIELPEQEGKRWTLEIAVPDAKLWIKEEGTLSWNDYESIAIKNAVLETR